MESRGGYRGPPSADRDGNFRKRRLDGSVDGVETRYNNGNRENGYERSGKIQKTRDSYAQAPQRSYPARDASARGGRGGLFKPSSSARETGVIALPTVVSSALATKRKQYFSKWQELLQLELNEETTEIESRLRNWPVERLIRDGHSLLNLSASHAGYSSEKVLLKFYVPGGGPLPFHRLCNGDMVNMNTIDSVEGERINIRGAILERSRNFLLVLAEDSPFGLDKFKWRLDKGANAVNFERCMRGLKLMTSPDPADLYTGSIDRRYVPQKEPRKILQNIIIDNPEKAREAAAKQSILAPSHNFDKFKEEFESWGLNDSQRKTILTALGRTLTLIQGPPGTGKTHTAVHLIKLLCMLYKEHKIPILACAYTNVATDNLLEGLRNQGVEAIRVGRPVKVRPELRDATLDAKLQEHPRYQELNDLEAEIVRLNRRSKEAVSDVAAIQRDVSTLRSRLRSLQNLMIADIIKDAPVICCTCIGAGDDLLRDFYFPFVIMDECTQATEPAVLVPLSNSCPQQVVMIGDHFQLPPTVKSNEAGSKGMSVSLFSRLVHEVGLEVSMLEIQYRMHPTIAEFPASHFYGGKLLTGIVGSQRPLIPGFPWPSDQPVAFIQISSEERRAGDGKSKMNEGEAQTVANIVKRFLTAGNSRSQLGIITPYAAQVRKIFDLLSSDKNFHMNLSVDDVDAEDGEWREALQLGFSISSVDGFQGREKDLIIMSAVRSNAQKKLGFLKDWRRLNVALTRARRGLVVIGNRQTLETDPHFQSFFEYIDAHTMTVDADDLLELQVSASASVE